MDLALFIWGVPSHLLTVVGCFTMLVGFALMTDGRGVLPLSFAVLTFALDRLPFPYNPPPFFSGWILLLVGVVLVASGMVMRMRNRKTSSEVE